MAYKNITWTENENKVFNFCWDPVTIWNSFLELIKGLSFAEQYNLMWCIEWRIEILAKQWIIVYNKELQALFDKLESDANS